MTLDFVICLNHDCSGFDFTEKTGRLPVTETGYGEFENIAPYTGTISFLDKNGTVIATFDVNPSTDGTAEHFLFATVIAEMTDQAYKVRYTVKDAGGVTLGIRDKYLIVDCAIQCALLELATKGNCENCRKKNLENGSEIRRYYEAALARLNGNDHAGAWDSFDIANQISHRKCKCNG